ncbi:MAG: hypothetical protein HOV68_15255 [Streptomycetaceae bacterium]|nr:hypothetical protein [Streptomycetaceae bacterium]
MAADNLVVFAADLAVIAYGSKAVIVTGVIVSGALLGINNTVFTEMALEVSDAPRPAPA